MDKKESFKTFAKTHPELISSIKNGEASWQKLYEIYDIYGEDDRAWDTYFKKKEESANSNTLGSLADLVKNINVESVQKHINTAQKALGIVQEFAGKGATSLSSVKGPLTPRPINKFFED